MAGAAPFIASMVVGKVVSSVVGKITGNEQIGALAGFAAGAWAGNLPNEAAATPSGTTAATPSEAAGTTAKTPEIVAGGASTPDTVKAVTTKPSGLLEKSSSWIERNPVKSQMLLGAVQGMAEQRMGEKERREMREAEADRYEREHQAADPTKIRSLEDVNRGLIEGGYRSLGEKAGSELPNYQQLLERYRRK